VAKNALDGPVVAFEAPHRILQTLDEFQVLLFDYVVVFRELTKLHESRYEGRPSEVSAQIHPVAGEFTIVVPQREPQPAAGRRPSDADVVLMFGQITDKTARAAARDVARATGLSANEVYAIVQRGRG
jgi:16S rRNA C1402 (ribose-2'-O) methylase RsmI